MTHDCFFQKTHRLFPFPDDVPYGDVRRRLGDPVATGQRRRGRQRHFRRQQSGGQRPAGVKIGRRGAVRLRQREAHRLSNDQPGRDPDPHAGQKRQRSHADQRRRGGLHPQFLRRLVRRREGGILLRLRQRRAGPRQHHTAGQILLRRTRAGLRPEAGLFQGGQGVPRLVRPAVPAVHPVRGRGHHRP